MNHSSINILIASGDPNDASQLTEALKNILPSCQPIFTTDGIAALRYIKTNAPPDIVFLDLNMPFKNGINCLKDIYNLNLLPGIPIIIYSTSNNIKDIDEAYKHNAAFYIIKPPSFKVLREIIQRALTILVKPSTRRVDKVNFVLSETKLYKDDIRPFV